ncbi:3-dehydroquinate synthase [Candidatus Woesearchaeota archaeon]|nr:3-dehydroquinate synthase [Candidatus Woesearchaeota archaeon]
MDRIRLSLAKRIDDSYDIIIGRDIFPQITDGLANLNIGKIAVITDSNVKELYGNNFLSMLKQKNMDAMLISFPAGEINKNRQTKEKIEDILISSGMERDGLIIALGGGVVGDIAGFVASTYMRGIFYTQVPTTLLAMVDSSIGGKTAVNTSAGKNLIGTFYQPKKVFVDVNTLNSLSRQEILNGVAEMIKHAIILDRKYFYFLNDYIENILALHGDILTKAVKWSCILKKKIVEQDEEEASLRKMLNFGHTIGHAVEKSRSYGISHGAAVAIGMVAETKISEEMGVINQLEAGKIYGLIRKAGFKTGLSDEETGNIIDNTRHDKKNTGAKVRYVLPRKIGAAEIDFEASNEIVSKALGEIK